jgi:release factor glutamine methyltransferase
MAAARQDPRPDVVARLRAAGCVFAEEEAALLVADAGTAAELDDLVSRRVAGLPLEHVLGWAEFCGLRIAVDPGVFRPRRRTELLVTEAAALARRGDVVVDLCCGTAAVGVAMGVMVAGLTVHAADIDPAAVACARRNLEVVGGQVHEGDLYDALPAGLRGGVDLVVVNAPYVPSDEIALLAPEARDHEPRVSLDGGGDGLDVQRLVAADAPEWLVPGGHLLIETSERQAPTTLEAFSSNGFSARIIRSEEPDATVVVGTLGG